MKNGNTDKPNDERERQNLEADRRPDPPSTEAHRDEILARLRQRFKMG